MATPAAQALLAFQFSRTQILKAIHEMDPANTMNARTLQAEKILDRIIATTERLRASSVTENRDISRMPVRKTALSLFPRVVSPLVNTMNARTLQAEKILDRIIAQEKQNSTH
jgi:hypothetical protein